MSPLKISNNVSYQEAIKSNTAIKNGIDNRPNEEQLSEMKLIANKIFQPIREHFGVSIAISSFFRSVELNKKIGGSSRSQHCKGQAMDLDADVYGQITNAQIFNFIKDNLVFDQLIWEFGTDENPNWVHVSYKITENRNKILVSKYINNKVTYSIF